MDNPLNHPAWTWEWNRHHQAYGAAGIALVWALLLVPMVLHPSVVLCVCCGIGAGFGFLGAAEVADGTEEWLLALPPSRRSRWCAKLIPAVVASTCIGAVCWSALAVPWPQAIWSLVSDGGLYDWWSKDREQHLLPFLVVLPPLFALTAAAVALGNDQRSFFSGARSLVVPLVVGGSFLVLLLAHLAVEQKPTSAACLALAWVMLPVSAWLGHVIYVGKHPSSGPRR